MLDQISRVKLTVIGASDDNWESDNTKGGEAGLRAEDGEGEEGGAGHAIGITEVVAAVVKKMGKVMRMVMVTVVD